MPDVYGTLVSVPPAINATNQSIDRYFGSIDSRILTCDLLPHAHGPMNRMKGVEAFGYKRFFTAEAIIETGHTLNNCYWNTGIQPLHNRQNLCRFETRTTKKESIMTETAAIGTEQAPDKTAIRPFQFNFPDAELADLRRRINATRWPERELVQDASQGVQLATMQKLARLLGERITTGARCEAKLNAVSAIRDQHRRARHPFHSR